MRRLLWVGDAACDSGFAKCTHYTLEVLRRTWDVSVLGLNYRGYPHNYPYPIYPAYVPGGDLFGVRHLGDIVRRVKPDLIVIQNDPWNIPAYMRALEKAEVKVPVVGAIAVDGLNCAGRSLNDLTRAIFWTEFAQEEARKGGMTIPSGVVPLGVDLSIYSPGDRREARRKMGLPQDVIDGFVFGNVNRNQPRKRLDLTIRYFGIWLRESGVDDAFLYLHVCPTGDMGYDVENLARYYGFNSKEKSRLILAEPGVWRGASEAWMVETYRAFDAQVSTTQGEGWGLTTIEGMACGVPQILPDWSALGEWAREGALMVPCTSTVTTPGAANVIGGVPDERAFIKALDDVYHDANLRAELRAEGFRVAHRPEYDWENIGEAFANQLEKAIA